MTLIITNLLSRLSYLVPPVLEDQGALSHQPTLNNGFCWVHRESINAIINRVMRGIWGNTPFIIVSSYHVVLWMFYHSIIFVFPLSRCLGFESYVLAQQVKSYSTCNILFSVILYFNKISNRQVLHLRQFRYTYYFLQIFYPDHRGLYGHRVWMHDLLAFGQCYNTYLLSLYRWWSYDL